MNCTILGNIQYVLANLIGTYFSSELEFTLFEKAMKNMPEPNQYLSCVNHRHTLTDLAVLNL